MVNGDLEQLREAAAKTGPPSEAEKIDRLVMVMQIFHQPYGQEPDGLSCRYEHVCSSHEQAFKRWFSMPGNSQKKLDYAWVENPGSALIQNTTAIRSSLLPTQESVLEMKERLLFLHVNNGVIPIPPGKFVIIPELIPTQSYMLVTGNSGPVDVHFMIFPR